MEIEQLITVQRSFDEAHQSRFEWSERASPENTQPLVYIALALAGEVGELANVVKKLERGDIAYAEAMSAVRAEAADVFIYLLKLSYQAGINLEEAFHEKLKENKVRFASREKHADHR